MRIALRAGARPPSTTSTARSTALSPSTIECRLPLSSTGWITNRHGGKGHIVSINGDIGAFSGPRGMADVEPTTGELTANDFWCRAKGTTWHQLAPSWPTNPRPYGWSNAPK